MSRQRSATMISFNTTEDKGKVLTVGDKGWLEWKEAPGGVDAEARKAIGELSKEMANVGKPTDEQVSAAVNAYLTENPVQSTPIDPHA